MSEYLILGLIGSTFIVLYLGGLVTLGRIRRNALHEVRGVLEAGRARTDGRATIDVYRYRRLSVPMVVELADLEGFELAGEERLRNHLLLRFTRREAWGRTRRKNPKP